MPRPENPALRSSITALRDLLLEIAQTNGHELFTIAVLESQARTVGLTLPDKGILPMSLNTAKRIANAQLPGGFKELDDARQAALASRQTEAGADDALSRNESLLKRCHQAEAKVAALEEDLLHISGAFKFALDCARRCARQSNNPALMATFLHEEREILARASLVRRPLHSV